MYEIQIYCVSENTWVTLTFGTKHQQQQGNLQWNSYDEAQAAAKSLLAPNVAFKVVSVRNAEVG